MAETEAEIHRPGVLETPKPRRRLKITDIVVFAVLAVIIVALILTLVNKLSLRHDVSGARTVSDKVIADLQKRDGAAARKLGSPTFQKTFTDQQLTNEFQAIKIATLKPPALDRQTVYDGNNGRQIFFIYKYTALKVPFYVRTALKENGGAWRLTQISGSADETKLIVQ